MRAALALILAAGCGRVGFTQRTTDARGGDGDGPIGDDGGDAASGVLPAHRYQLAGNYDDDFGGPPLVSHGGSFSSGGYSFGTNQGLTLAGVLGAAYTIDIQFQLTDILSGWRKLVDFSGLVKDEGFYTYDSALQFVIVSGADFETTRATLLADTPIRLTITRSAAGDVNAYMARAPQPAMRNTVPDPPTGTASGSRFEFTDTAGQAAPNGANSVAFFIDDSGTGMGEATSGTAREIAIWDRPLTNSEVAALP